MFLSSRSSACYALAAALSTGLVAAQSSNNTMSGLTTRYWDCCKPSCGWNAKASFNNPVQSCDANNNPLSSFNEGTGCNGGTAYACADQSPWAVNDTFSYGFAGAFVRGGSESTWCCSCYQLRFTSGSVAGKTMIIQATNTDYDTINQNVFALAIPGGNNSYGGCGRQYGVDTSVFGTQMSGVSSRDMCSQLPEPQRAGCLWRYDWFEDANGPDVEFSRVTCPTELTNITGCTRNDDTTFTQSAQTGAASTLSMQSWSPLLSAVLMGSVFARLLA